MKLNKSDPFRKEKIMGLIFVTPLLVGFLVFSAYPLVSSIYLSFTDYNIYTKPNFIGFQNYINLLNDARFWKIMKNTVLYVAGNVQTSGLAPIKIGMAGSPTTRQYEILNDGEVVSWGLNGSPIYKKIYIRYLANGSFIGE